MTIATELRAALERSRALGFLGEGPVDPHIGNGRAFAALVPRDAVVLDLGSGGGVPGLVIAAERDDVRVVLLDGMRRRTSFLDEAVAELGLETRVEVVTGRAEEVGRTAYRSSFDVVTARSFGPPAVTAECGAPFLRVGGSLLVSEPPGTVDRWPPERLAELGLEPGVLERSGSTGIRVLHQRRSVPDRYPRRVGIPAKRPLF